MLNAEYWRDQIGILNGWGKIAVVDDFPVCCDTDDWSTCSKCDLLRNDPNAKKCDHIFIDWLIKEHKEPDIDWARVPLGTPVRVWDGNGGDMEIYDRPFMCYMPNKKNKFWAFSEFEEQNSADAWEHCQLTRKGDTEKYRRKTDD